MQNVGPLLPDPLNHTYVLAKNVFFTASPRSQGWVPGLSGAIAWPVLNKGGCLGPTPAELDGPWAGRLGLGISKASRWIPMGRKSENHQARWRLLPSEAF